MSELILISVFLLILLLQNALLKVCINYKHKSWSSYLYVIASMLLFLPIGILIKDGWIEKFGLEKTALLVLLIGFMLFYFCWKVAKGLSKIQD